MIIRSCLLMGVKHGQIPVLTTEWRLSTYENKT